MEAFVIHYTPLVDRKAHITQELTREGITPVFIEKYDREHLTETDIARFILSHKLRIGTVSLFLKQVEAWRRIASGSKEFGIIFEDDAVLTPGFVATLETYMKELPTDYDILMINEGCNFHIPAELIVADKHVYLRGVHPTTWGGNGGTRCLDGYVLSKKCASKFVEIFDSRTEKSISLEVDWWMNVVMRAISANVYWAEPSIVKQGSEVGLFKSSH
jgi:GR25 family glycosyltransferase involved in LPS biosynthesis